MRVSRSLRHFAVFAAVLTVTFAVAASAHAATLRSSARNQRSAVMEYSGFYLTPVGTEPEGPGDLAPPQLFELIRPGQQAISLGRLYTSCVCVALEADKDYYADGERAVLRLRNIKASPPEGTMYALYVQLRSPVRTILRVDTFLQSTMFIPSKPGEAPTRGDIVVDGVLEGVPAETAAGDAIEIIVPKADAGIEEVGEEAEATAEKAEEAVEEVVEDSRETVEETKELVEEAAAEALNDAKKAAIEARAAKLKE